MTGAWLRVARFPWELRRMRFVRHAARLRVRGRVTWLLRPWVFFALGLIAGLLLQSLMS